MKGAIPIILIAVLAAWPGTTARAATIDEILNACRTDADQRAGAPALPDLGAAQPPGSAKQPEGDQEQATATPKPKPSTKPKRKPRGSAFAYANARKAALAGNGEEAIDRLLECPQAQAVEAEMRENQDFVVKRFIDDLGAE
ncbi:MAG: hypothetical protein U1E67_21210 [Hyphomicrobiales bacterium]